MTTKEKRIDAIAFDLKESINDLLHEVKELVKDVEELKKSKGE